MASPTTALNPGTTTPEAALGRLAAEAATEAEAAPADETEETEEAAAPETEEAP